MRSTEYDTVSDRYDRFLRMKFCLRSRPLQHPQGRLQPRHHRLVFSGICSFNAAWQMPDQFSRVITWIGSFSSIQWKEDPSTPTAARITRKDLAGTGA